jgi:hypothetical protein
MILEKKCSKCGNVKILDDFYKQKGGYLEKRADCKICSIKKIKEWQLNHLDYNKIYLINNPEKRKKYSDKYYNNNKDKCLKYGHEYYKNNKDERNKYTREYYKEHSLEHKEYNKAYYKRNKEKFREYAKRYKNNIELATIKWMRNALYRTEQQGFNKVKMNTIMEFGYTPKQLIERIECQFKDGMSWKNRNEWHIDHKKPISKFSKNTNSKTINMLCNLRPIWAEENLSKGNR